MWFLRSQMNLHVSRVHPEHCPEDSQADLSQRTLRRDFDTIHNSGTVHNSEDSPRGLPLEDCPQRTPLEDSTQGILRGVLWGNQAPELSPKPFSENLR